MVDAAIYNGSENYISTFINDAFGKNADMDIYFKDKDLGFGTDTDDGRTDVNYYRNSGYCRIDITLSSRTLPHSSKEYIAATILHEAIHAWIIVSQTSADATGSVSHETMAINSNITKLSEVLKKMHPGISQQDAIDLTWGGLQYTSAWNNLTADEKSRIGQTNNSYKKGMAGTKCNN